MQSFELAFLQHIFIISILKHSCGNTPSVPKYLTHIISHFVSLSV